MRNIVFEKMINRLSVKLFRIWNFIRNLYKGMIVSRLRDSDPIFILGVQKSGTTAIASLLADATGKSVTLDIKRAIKRPWAKLLRKYGVEGFEDYLYRYRREFSREIVKEPGLTFDYLELKNLFPKARFVMIIREPKDNIRSILNRLKIPGNLQSLNYEEWPELKMSPAWRINLDSSWLGHCPASYVDSLAYRWKLASDIYFNHSADLILIRYEDFIANKKGIIDGLACELGLELIADISDRVDVQHQSKGIKIENYEEFYGHNITFLERHCKAGANALGYW